MNKKMPVTFEHAKLRRLAKKLKRFHKDDIEILWLASALQCIGSGKDANIEFGVQRGKGQDDKKERKHLANQIAIRWIAGRMNPIDGERPPMRKVAIEEAATLFNIDYENLDKACPNLQKLKTLVEFDWDSQRPKIQKPRD